MFSCGMEFNVIAISRKLDCPLVDAKASQMGIYWHSAFVNVLEKKFSSLLEITAPTP